MQNKKYDLEERTLTFAKLCIDLCRSLKKDVVNFGLINQLIRSAGSVGANYREANNTTTRKDFYYRMGICRREAKESKFWLELIQYANHDSTTKVAPLIDEAWQLARIFSSIVKENKKDD